MRDRRTWSALFLSALLGSCSDSAADKQRDDAAAAQADDDAFRLTDDPMGTPSEVAKYRDDWPLPNHDYDNTRATFTASIDSTNVMRLREAWRFEAEVASGPFGSMSANPVILGDAIFLQDMASNVYRLARDTGALAWKASPGGLTVGPNGVAVAWGRVFANIGDTGILALDASSGRELWRFTPTLVSSEGIDIQPVAYDGLVYVSTVPASLRGGYLGGSRGILTALDAKSGITRWTFDTVDSRDLWGNAEENAGGGAWYPPLVDPARKRTYWGTGNPAPWPGTIAAPSGATRPGPNLYTSSLVALDESGALVWYHQERAHDLFDWDFQGSPMRIAADATRNAPERIIGSGKTGTVVALDADSGSLIWRAKVGRHENDALTELPVSEPVVVYPGALGGVLTATAYADGVVYVPVVDMAAEYTGSDVFPDLGNGRGALTALDAVSGEPMWNAELPAPNYGAAAVVNDLVFTSDANGRVYAFARDSGREVWHWDAPGGINAPLAVAGDLLLVSVGVNASLVIALRLS